MRTFLLHLLVALATATCVIMLIVVVYVVLFCLGVIKLDVGPGFV